MDLSPADLKELQQLLKQQRDVEQHELATYRPDKKFTEWLAEYYGPDYRFHFHSFRGLWSIEHYEKEIDKWLVVLWWHTGWRYDPSVSTWVADDPKTQLYAPLCEKTLEIFRTVDVFHQGKDTGYTSEQIKRRAAIRERQQQQIAMDNINAAFDGMTRRQQEQFMELERALATGEDIYLESDAGPKRMLFPVRGRSRDQIANWDPMKNLVAPD